MSPEADWFPSTDCLSHQFEAHEGGATPAVVNVRCGHVVGAAWGRAFNGGHYIMRNS